MDEIGDSALVALAVALLTAVPMAALVAGEIDLLGGENL